MAQAYIDLYQLEEDKRVELIGKSVIEGPLEVNGRPFVVGIMVEDNAKADRYVKKITDRFPTVKEIDRSPHIAGTVMVRFGRATQ